MKSKIQFVIEEHYTSLRILHAGPTLEGPVFRRIEKEPTSRIEYANEANRIKALENKL